jgi:hypothetical protein
MARDWSPPAGSPALAAPAVGRPGWPLVAWPARDDAAARLGAFPGGLSRRAAALLFALALALALLPVAVVHLAPLTDYPFHMARISILEHWQAWPGLHAFYAIRSFLLPNITTDVILLGLAQLMPLEIAGRVLVGLTLAVNLSGAVALHWSLHRRAALWPLVAALFLHNWIFVFGFLNYVFGIGLMLWGMALWIALAERPAALRLAGGAAIALAIFFAHMVAFGLYALMVAGFELQRALARWRANGRAAIGRLVVGALPFVLPLALFVLLSPTGREADGEFKYAPEWYWKGFVVARTFMSMNLGLDFLTAAALLIVLVLIVLRGRILFAREMLLAWALLAVTFVVIPWKMFGAVFVDARLPLAILFVTIASSQATFGRAWAGRAVYALLGTLLVTRSIVLAADWTAFDKTYDSVTAALAAVPANSVLVSATAAPPPRSLTEWVDHWRPPVHHAASLVLLQKPVFAVTTWATPSQQPIAVTPAWERLYRYQEQNPMPVDGAAELATFVARVRALIAAAGGANPPPAYLMLLYPDYLHDPLPPGLTRVAAGRRFLLFRID